MVKKSERHKFKARPRHATGFMCEMVIIVFRRSPISLQCVRKESDDEVNTKGGDERGRRKERKGGRRTEERRRNRTEKTNKQTNKTERTAKNLYM